MLKVSKFIVILNEELAAVFTIGNWDILDHVLEVSARQLCAILSIVYYEHLFVTHAHQDAFVNDNWFAAAFTRCVILLSEHFLSEQIVGGIIVLVECQRLLITIVFVFVPSESFLWHCDLCSEAHDVIRRVHFEAFNDTLVRNVGLWHELN